MSDNSTYDNRLADAVRRLEHQAGEAPGPGLRERDLQQQRGPEASCKPIASGGSPLSVSLGLRGERLPQTFILKPGTLSLGRAPGTGARRSG